MKPLRNFLRLEAAGGLFLMAAAALALIVANSPLGSYYGRLLDLPLEVRIGDFGIAKPLLLWINDGLMAVFFLLVGMELKREVVEGHLSSLRRASLPAFAALGGMIAPAAIYAALNRGDAVAMRGWAIPTATDIAFALGVLTLLGRRVPGALKAFLLTVAIFDDLGAIIVIAIFYTAKLSTVSLVVAAILLLGLALLNRFGVTRPGAYGLLGVALWVAVLKSGVHATLAGVALAMFIPLRAPKGPVTSRSPGPLLPRLEHALHPWVAFGVLPVFAFANAGVSMAGLSIGDILHPVPLGIVSGLFIGKQIGIIALCWIATRLRLASLPVGVGWRQLYGVALLCGIGFTMSLFIAALAFEGDTAYLGMERLGILVGTFVSGVAGFLVLRVALRKGAGMQRVVPIVAVLLCALPAFSGCAGSKHEAPDLDVAKIDAGAKQLMERESVQGLALAIIDEGQVAHVAAYGRRSVENDLPLTTDTIMYGASLTKAAFAYMMMQLVDEGSLDLDKSIADYLPRPLPDYDDYTDLAGDERWRVLTPRILLTHTSGFANFRWLEEDQKLRFHFPPGTRYGYSGEGFYILQLVLEEGLGLDVGREMQKRVFDRFGMTNTSMTWRPDFAANLADGYGLDGAMEPHDERSGVSAAGSMDTSIADQARLWAGIVSGDGLGAPSRAEMMRAQVPITSPHQFPTLNAVIQPRNADIGLAAGLGVVTFQDASGPAWFKGGHNDWTGNMVICIENGKRCVVMLANDVRAERIYPELARMILGDTAMPWSWEYEWYKPAAEK